MAEGYAGEDQELEVYEALGCKVAFGGGGATECLLIQLHQKLFQEMAGHRLLRVVVVVGLLELGFGGVLEPFLRLGIQIIGQLSAGLDVSLQVVGKDGPETVFLTDAAHELDLCHAARDSGLEEGG